MKFTTLIKLFFKIVFTCLLILAVVKTYHEFSNTKQTTKQTTEETFKSYPFHDAEMLG